MRRHILSAVLVMGGLESRVAEADPCAGGSQLGSHGVSACPSPLR
jgi:hypothetical protein